MRAKRLNRVTAQPGVSNVCLHVESGLQQSTRVLHMTGGSQRAGRGCKPGLSRALRRWQVLDRAAPPRHSLRGSRQSPQLAVRDCKAALVSKFFVDGKRCSIEPLRLVNRGSSPESPACCTRLDAAFVSSSR